MEAIRKNLKLSNNLIKSKTLKFRYQNASKTKILIKINEFSKKIKLDLDKKVIFK
jgi:hypothetical protein